MIPYSTVPQLGYLLLALALAGRVPGALVAAVLLAACHAAAKAALFLCAGSLYRAYGHDRIDDLSGIAARMPLTATAFALAAVSLVGTLLAATTTWLSFGLLAVSSTPAVSNFGLTVSLGLAFSFFLAPWAIHQQDPPPQAGRPYGAA